MAGDARGEGGRAARIARRTWRIAWRVALGALALAIVAVVVLVIVLQTDWGRERVRRIMEAQLDELFVGDVEVGRVEGNLLSGFAVKEIVIHDAAGEVALRLGSVEMDHSVWALFHRAVHASSLRVDQVEITARETEPGVWNVASLLRPSEREPTRWRLVADRIEVRNGAVVVQRADGRVDHLGGLELDAHGTFGATRVALSLERLSASWVERAVDIGARAEVEVDPARVAIRATSLEAGSVAVEVPNATADLETGAISLEGAVRAAAQQPSARLKVPASSLQITATRADRSEPVAVELNGSAGAASVRGHADVDPEKRSVVGSLDLRMPDLTEWIAGTTRGEASANLSFSLAGTGLDDANGTVTVSARGFIDDLRLENLAATARIAERTVQLDLSASAPGATATVNGRVVADRGGAFRVDSATIRANADLSRAIRPWLQARGSLDADLEIEGTLPELAVKGRVDGARLAVSDLRIPSLTASVDVSDALKNPEGSLALSLHAPRFRDLGMRALSARANIERAGKTVRVTVRGRGPPDSIRADLRVAPRQWPIRVELESLRADVGGVHARAHAALSYDRAGSVEVADLRITSNVGHVSGSGRVDFAAGEVQQARLVARDGRVDLGALRRALGIGEPLRGKIVFSGDLRAERGGLSGEISAGADGVAFFPHAPTVDGKATVRFSRRRVALTGDAAIEGLGTATVSAAVRPPRDVTRPAAWRRLRRSALIEARLEIDPMDVRRLARVVGRDVEVRGTVAGELQVDAGADSGKGQFELRGFHVEPLRDPVGARLGVWLEGRGAARLALDIDAGSTGKARLEASGELPSSLFDPAVWRRIGLDAVHTARIELEHVRLDRELLRGAGDWVAGVGAIDGTVQLDAGANTASLDLAVARLSLPRADESANLRIRGGVDASGAAWAKVEASGKRSGSAAIEAHVAGPAKLLDLAAWGAVDERAVRSVHASVSGVRLEEWRHLLPESAPEISGRLLAELDLGSGLKTGSLTVSGRKLRVPQLERRLGLDVTAELRPDEIEAKLTGKLGARKLVSGHLKLGLGMDELRRTRGRSIRDAKATGSFAVNELSLTSAFAAVGKSYPAQGHLTASGSISGSLAAPVVKGRVDLAGARIRGVEFRKLNGTFGFTDAEISARLTARQQKGGTLTVAAVAPRGESDAVSGSVEARAFDLGFVTAFLPDTELEGKLFSDLAVSGTWSSPRAKGWARVEEARLRTGIVLPPLYDGHAELAVKSEKLTVKAHARAGRGRVEATASAKLAALEPVSATGKVTLRAFPVEAGDMMVSIDSSVTAKAKKAADAWSLDVNVGDTTVRLPRKRTRTLYPVGRPEDVVFVDETHGSRHSALSALRRRASQLRVTVRADESIAIHGPEVNTQIGANLVLEPLPTLSIRGSVAAVGGYVELFGRKYEIRRASASFAGDESVEPYVDVRLAHEFPSLTLYIDVIGPLDHPTGRLSSDPASYDETQLLAFVLGATPGEEAPSKPLSDRGVSVASSLLTSQLQQMVAGVLPVDVIKVELDQESNRAELVTIGRWITDRLFLAYRHHFAATPLENNSEAAIEYRLFRRWILEAYAGDQGAGGADLLWIHRY